MAAKTVAFLLVMTLMVSTFTVETNAFDLSGSGRSLLRLRFFTDIVEVKETTRPATSIQVQGTSRPAVEVAATASSTTTEAPAPSVNEKKKEQTWVTWFNNMFSGSSSSGAPASAPSA